jgi:glycosyltransferase involved in cell wall biosynthesis
VSLSTKIFEYAAMGKPVVATDLPMVAATFPRGSITTYEPGDPGSLAAAVESLIDDVAAREAAVRAAAVVVDARSWERESGRYVALVDSLART